MGSPGTIDGGMRAQADGEFRSAWIHAGGRRSFAVPSNAWQGTCSRLARGLSAHPESSSPRVQDPWSDVAAALGVAPADLRRVRQVHGSSVVVVRASDPRSPAALSEADIIMTDDPTIGIAIQTADCVPLLMADARTGAVAAAHAGWRGLAAGVPGVAVGGARPALRRSARRSRRGDRPFDQRRVLRGRGRCSPPVRSDAFRGSAGQLVSESDASRALALRRLAISTRSARDGGRGGRQHSLQRALHVHERRHLLLVSPGWAGGRPDGRGHSSARTRVNRS